MTRRSAGQDDRPWTTRRLLEWTSGYLERQAVDAPRLAAEMLLGRVLGVERIRLYMDLDRPSTELERAAYRQLVERAAAHEPVQYLVGEAYFFALPFKVTADVLIPRPSTELLVEHVIQHTRQTPGLVNARIADVGTGSGCIAVAVAQHLLDCHVVATDVDEQALAVGRANAEQHGVADRIEWRCGSLYEPLAGGRFNYIAANPPYISDAEWDQLPANVKDHEPARALRGGSDGLDYLRPLIAGAAYLLSSPGQLVLEIAASQKQAVLDLAAASKGLAHPRVLPDREGHPRMLLADRA